MLYLFDIDGTLLRAGGAGTRALGQLFLERYGVTAAMDGVSPAGKTDPMILAEIFAARLGREPGPGETDDLLDAYVPILRRELSRSPAFRTLPRVAEAIAFLETDPSVVLAIATGNVRGAAEAKLERADLLPRFRTGGYGCDEADRAALVERAIERGLALATRALSRDEIVVVGDTPRDVRAARACGVRAVAVATGVISKGELAASEPDALMDTLAELPAWHRAGLRVRGGPRP